MRSPSSTGRPRRAAPLPPDERRDAILHAVRPLLLARGTRVTTRELADAAGVAEGTLFRVFDSKEALVREAALAAVDPVGDLPQTAAISPRLPLDERVRAVLEIATRRIEQFGQWMSLLHEIGRPEGAAAGPHAGGPHGPGRHGSGPRGAWAERRAEADALMHAQLVEVLRPDEDALCMGLEEAAGLLQVVIVGTAMRSMATAGPSGSAVGLSPDLLVRMFLGGVAGATGPAPPPGGDTDDQPTPPPPHRRPPC